MSNNSISARWYFFTISATLFNNDSELVKQFFNSLPHIKHWVFQMEKGSQSTELNKNGYLHFQCSACFDIPLKFSTVHNAITKINPDYKQIHLEQCRASDASILYCSKSQTRVNGPWFSSVSFETSCLRKIATKSKKNNSKIIQLGEFFDDNIQEHENLNWFLNPNECEFAQDFAFHKKFLDVKFAQYLDNVKSKKRLIEPITCLFIYGPSNSGKTSLIAEALKDKDYFRPTLTNPIFAFSGIGAEEIVWLDDKQDALSSDNFRQLSDNFDYYFETKGSFIKSCVTQIIITTNLTFEKYWHFDDIQSNFVKSSIYKRFLKPGCGIFRFESLPIGVHVGEDVFYSKDRLKCLKTLSKGISEPCYVTNDYKCNPFVRELLERNKYVPLFE